MSNWVGRRGWGCISLVLAVLLFSGSARGAMEIEGLDNNTAPASNYDRYDNSSSWIGLPANWPGGAPGSNTSSPYVWSGVGRDANNGTWGTMIAPQFFISANHYHPAIGDTLQFNYNNDPNGPSETETVLAGAWMQAALPGNGGADGDVWIGLLSQAVSSNVAIYPILKMNFNSEYGGLGISTFGLSATIPGTVTTVRMGRNVIDAGTANYYTGLNPADYNGVSNFYGFQYTYNNTASNRGVGNDEAQVVVGDSGAPTFFLYGGSSPALIGTHWLAGTSGGNLVTVDTLDSDYVNYNPALNDVQKVMNQLADANSVARENVTLESPVLGDFNLDGKFDASDIPAMIAALSNLNSYESLHGMNASYLDYIGDLNDDGVVNNADLQAMIALLKMGYGTMSSVPEPASVVLLGLGGLAALAGAWRRRA